jgi:spermidine synthase
LAAYARPGQSWTFFEIDPAVERIARDRRLFTYLDRCGRACRVVLGDARLSLQQDAGTYDVLVLDAFSSDAIPVHRITREAVALYLSRLRSGGLLAFHSAIATCSCALSSRQSPGTWGSCRRFVTACRRQLRRVHVGVGGDGASHRGSPATTRRSAVAFRPGHDRDAHVDRRLLEHPRRDAVEVAETSSQAPPR